MLGEVVVQPDVIEIEPGLRLRKFDGKLERMLAGYRDPVVYQNSEGIFEEDKIPDLTYIEGMCRYLTEAGELYFIEVEEDGAYVSVGDVTVKSVNPPIAIWFAKYRGIGIGTKVMRTVIDRLQSLGYEKITGSTVYKWNTVSQKMHERLGFRLAGETEDEYVYERTIL